MRFWVLVAAAVLGGCWSEASPVVGLPIVVPPQPRHSHVVERGPYAALVGHWVGHGFQYDTQSDWDIELTFDPAAGIGDPIGLVEYPGLACGGVLTRRPEHEDGTLVVLETITHGQNCVDGGTFQFPRDPVDHKLPWKWFMPNTGIEQAEGTVHR